MFLRDMQGKHFAPVLSLWPTLLFHNNYNLVIFYIAHFPSPGYTRYPLSTFCCLNAINIKQYKQYLKLLLITSRISFFPYDPSALFPHNFLQLFFFTPHLS